MQEIFFHSLASVPLKEVVKQEYRNYQIYTLMDRAIPYLQDGLKPCQRRILYTLWKNSNKGLLKVSAATGLVLTLHPHGPASIESSIVNMAQDFCFSNNYPLIDKKGYFGERMETAPAAGRYIECKLGKIAELILFDDMNQVEMIPNYDEKVTEPMALLPKLPIMLLNGAEGIGTGFSSVIPSFDHKDIIDSMINFIQKGKAKKIKPWVRFYTSELEVDEKGKILTHFHFEEKDSTIFITQAPRGYDAQRIYKHLTRFIEKDYLKDYIDSSVENTINIELIFKRGQQPSLEEVRVQMQASASLVPNYTLISENGVRVLECAEDIIEIFTQQRIEVVRKRYELLCSDCEGRLIKNNEIIRFINEKHYTTAVKCENRKSFTDYLASKEFVHFEYLADMPIYRLTKEEVSKREVMIIDDTKALKNYTRIAKSPALVKEKLQEELLQLKTDLSDLMRNREKEKAKLMKDFEKKKLKK